MRKTLIALAIAAASVGIAFAQGYGPGYGYGGGPGYGPMMGGGGYGPGMMGRGGPGGGYGPGYGGGGYGGGPLALELSDEQREKVFALQEDNRRKNWDTMGKMRSEMFKLRGMAYSDKVDSGAYVEQQKKVDDLRREVIKSRLESRKQMEAILTPEQRKQLRSFGPWCLRDDEE